MHELRMHILCHLNAHALFFVYKYLKIKISILMPGWDSYCMLQKFAFKQIFYICFYKIYICSVNKNKPLIIEFYILKHDLMAFWNFVYYLLVIYLLFIDLNPDFWQNIDLFGNRVFCRDLFNMTAKMFSFIFKKCK